VHGIACHVLHFYAFSSFGLVSILICWLNKELFCLVVGNGRNKCDFEASPTLSRFVGLFAQWSVAAGAWCLFVRNLVAELPTIRFCIYNKALLQEYHRYPEII
jgi:hypothetical protein